MSTNLIEKTSEDSTIDQRKLFALKEQVVFKSEFEDCTFQVSRKIIDIIKKEALKSKTEKQIKEIENNIQVKILEYDPIPDGFEVFDEEEDN